ncbi:unnamed protein product [Notodromas monacha]|uniref:Hexosyltransferase n=1 Tax=Notodromas monacha TaxID=399045 RepID=A0A7R9GHI5_9CRUS|nr:unnamed protein product [Notodromas monacha]CAG0922838.1 unnamed protein product [Notodromas monacha]
MKSVAGRDILKREICEGSSKNDHLTCGRHVQQFCVTDTRVTMTTTLRNSSDGFLCKDSTKIMILIISAPGNFEKRTNIRTTWGNNSVMNPIFPEVQLAFLVGKTNSTEDSKKIFEESIKYEDMIHILDHIDAYKNLTYKVLSGYQWALQNCRNVEVIGKFDDDIFVDMKTFVLAVKK